MDCVFEEGFELGGIEMRIMRRERVAAGVGMRISGDVVMEWVWRPLPHRLCR